MQKIHQLSEHIIAQIAAGEVIERPVYAVKELLENAIDAHASFITLDIEESGLKKITIIDNGEGMSQQDIAQSFKPHTTSKLRDNLIGIKTLGFRGEALSSIAAVSHLTIQSRLPKESSGTKVTLKSGVFQHIGPVGMPPGTIVTVQNLFSTIPARKKFLKSQRTEFRHIVELVTQYALSYPDVQFVLLHNKKYVIDLPKNQILQERISTLLGNSFYSQLLKIKNEVSHLHISGFIARPQLSTRGFGKQYLYINKRAVTDRLISAAVREAYSNLLEKTQNPVFVLFVTLPFEMIDVNVHPRKEQVAFINKNVIFDTVKESIQKTLQENNFTFFSGGFGNYSSRAGTTQSHVADVLKKEVDIWSVKDAGKIIKSSDIFQIHNLYLLVQTQKGFLFIDQHAAHERILYEQLLEEFNKRQKKQKSYMLKKSIIIDLSLSDSEILLEYKKTFEKLGFDIEPFRGNTYKVNAVPELFKDRDINILVLELLEDLSQKQALNMDSVTSTMLSYLACRSAIMRGEKLTQDEAKKLIEKLEKTANNATCPHGRPTKMEITLEEVNKMFKR